MPVKSASLGEPAGVSDGLLCVMFTLYTPAGATALEGAYFIPDGRRYYVHKAYICYGTNDGGVLLAIKKAANGTAISSGTSLGSHTCSGTANTIQEISLASATDAQRTLEATERVGIDQTGSVTTLVSPTIVLYLMPLPARRHWLSRK